MRNTKGQFIKGTVIGAEHRYTSEQMKGNQYAKGNKPNKTTYKQGDNVLDKHPCWKGGLHHSKLDGLYIMIESKKRIPYSRYVYLKHNKLDKLPPKHVIYHIDQDKTNNSIENLRLVTRAELIKINLENR